MKVLSVKQELRRHERWMLRGKHPTCKAVYCVALILLVVLGGVIRLACMGSGGWDEMYRCLLPIAIAGTVYFLLNKFPIIRLLRDHPGIGAMLLCYLLGFLCLHFYRLDRREQIAIWPAFMLGSVLIVASTAFVVQGYWRCSPCLVTGAAAIIGMLSLSMGDSFSAMLALMLALVLGCMAACTNVTEHKVTNSVFRCICVIFVWFFTCIGFLLLSDTFSMNVFNAFVDSSVSPLNPLGIKKYYDLLRACRFFGTAEAIALPELAQHDVMLTAAVKFGWGFFALLCLMLLAVIVAGIILVAQRKGMARLLGTGAILALLFTILGEPLRAFGIATPFLYTVPFFSGDTYASTLTLLTCLLVFPFEIETVYPYYTNFLYRELEEVHHYTLPDREARASGVVIRSLPLPEWELEVTQLFEGEENLIHLKEFELYDHLPGKDHCTMCRYYGAIWHVRQTFEQLSFRGEYVAVKITANRRADVETLLHYAKRLASTTLTADAGCCIAIDNTLNDDAVSIHMVIV